jgi:hypothetical protein
VYRPASDHWPTREKRYRIVHCSRCIETNPVGAPAGSFGTERATTASQGAHKVAFSFIWLIARPFPHLPHQLAASTLADAQTTGASPSQLASRSHRKMQGLPKHSTCLIRTSNHDYMRTINYWRVVLPLARKISGCALRRNY